MLKCSQIGVQEYISEWIYKSRAIPDDCYENFNSSKKKSQKKDTNSVLRPKLDVKIPWKNFTEHFLKISKKS